jgi:hypothetical protein
MILVFVIAMQGWGFKPQVVATMSAASQAAT